MAEAAFTPGPWKTGDCDGFIIWAGGFRSTSWIECEPGPEAVSIGSVDCPGWARVQPPEIDDDFGFARKDRWIEECRANACLIAAAPEFYGIAERALVLLEQQLSMILESHCLLDANLQPIRDTLEDDARGEVELLEREIADTRSLLAKARGEPTHG